MNQSHDRERSIFLRAIALLDDSDKLQAYIDEACGGDSELRRNVEALLAANRPQGDIFDNTPVLKQTLDDPSLGTQIGPYRIREQIGEGGMGVVYVAEQAEPVQRKVAIKVIKPGMDTREVIARFDAERQALAFMEHPNIARVLDAGSTESGRSYFVMELVRGIPITEYCDQAKLSPRERLKLFTTVCDAVQHAHQKGIIHRDIKPSNVLVTQISAKPVIKVIDFGLAKATSGQKLTDRTVYTGFMRLMGTPVYMSPEQAGLSGLDVDTRSDVYSLGVLLYELLTGTTPLDKTKIRQKVYEELCKQIREVEAPRPSARISTLKDAERSTIAQQRQIDPRGLSQLMHGDLDQVVLKALEKDRDRRYGSPQDLAADIDRFLDDKPVQAVPPSPLYLARKYIRRHKVAILTAAMIMALLFLATGFSTWQAIRATKSEQVAERERNVAEAAKREALESEKIAVNARKLSDRTAEQRRRLLYVANMQLADQLWNRPDGDPRKIDELLAKWIPVDDSESDLREFSWRYQWNLLHQGAVHTVYGADAISISSAGNLITADKQGIHEWHESGRVLSQRWFGDASGALLSTNGRWALIPVKSEGVSNGAELIDIGSGHVLRQLPGDRFAFSPAGRFLAYWDANGEIRVQTAESDDVETLRPLCTLATEMMPPEQRDLVLAPDGRSFMVRNLKKLTAFLEGHTAPIGWRNSTVIDSFTWSPDGSFMVWGDRNGKIQLRRISDPERPFLILGTHGKLIRTISFSANSSRLASGGSDGTIDILDVSKLHAVGEDEEPNQPFSEPKAQVSDAPSKSHQIALQLKAHVDDVQSIVFSPDGSKLASLDKAGVAKLWNLNNLNQDAYEIDKLTADYSRGRIGITWEVSDDGVRVGGVRSPNHTQIKRGDRLIGVSESASPQMVDVSGMDATDVLEQIEIGPYGSRVRLRLERSGSNKRTNVDMVRSVKGQSERLAFAPDGESLTVASSRLGATRWTVTGQGMRHFRAFGSSVAYSPDGRFLALADGFTIQLWDRRSDQLHATLESGVSRRHTRNQSGGSLAFSPDSKYLAIGTGYPFHHAPKSSDLRVWAIESLQEIESPLHVNDHILGSVLFTPDGTSLVAADHSGVIRIWSTSTWSLERTLELERVCHRNNAYEGPDWRREFITKLTAMDLSPDGKILALGFGEESRDSGIVLMDFESGEHLQILRGDRPESLDFSTDGKTLASNWQRAEYRTLGRRDRHATASVKRAYRLRPDHRLFARRKDLSNRRR